MHENGALATPRWSCTGQPGHAFRVPTVASWPALQSAPRAGGPNVGRGGRSRPDWAGLQPGGQCLEGPDRATRPRAASFTWEIGVGIVMEGQEVASCPFGRPSISFYAAAANAGLGSTKRNSIGLSRSAWIKGNAEITCRPGTSKMKATKPPSRSTGDLPLRVPAFSVEDAVPLQSKRGAARVLRKRRPTRSSVIKRENAALGDAVRRAGGDTCFQAFGCASCCWRGECGWSWTASARASMHVNRPFAMHGLG